MLIVAVTVIIIEVIVIVIVVTVEIILTLGCLVKTNGKRKILGYDDVEYPDNVSHKELTSKRYCIVDQINKYLKCSKFLLRLACPLL